MSTPATGCIGTKMDGKLMITDAFHIIFFFMHIMHRKQANFKGNFLQRNYMKYDKCKDLRKADENP